MIVAQTTLKLNPIPFVRSLERLRMCIHICGKRPSILISRLCIVYMLYGTPVFHPPYFEQKYHFVQSHMLPLAGGFRQDLLMGYDYKQIL